MREIKFRFWNVEEGYMEDWLSMQDSIDLGEFLNGDYPEYYIPMQYTGLKDKEGNEIYEGDIYEWTSDDTDGTTLKSYSVIIFEDGSFWANDSRDRGKETVIECVNYGDWEYVELVGNIYENKELLEEE